MGPTNPSEEHFRRGLWGWDGSVWRKLPMLWGYSGNYAEMQYNADTAAGEVVLTFGAVPEGEVRVLQGVSALNLVSANSRIEISVTLGGVGVHLIWTFTTALRQTVSYSDPVTMKKDDVLTIKFVGCTLHDNLRGYAWGYKMEIGE